MKIALLKVTAMVLLQGGLVAADDHQRVFASKVNLRGAAEAVKAMDTEDSEVSLETSKGGGRYHTKTRTKKFSGRGPNPFCGPNGCPDDDENKVDIRGGSNSGDRYRGYNSGDRYRGYNNGRDYYRGYNNGRSWDRSDRSTWRYNNPDSSRPWNKCLRNPRSCPGAEVPVWVDEDGVVVDSVLEDEMDLQELVVPSFEEFVAMGAIVKVEEDEEDSADTSSDVSVDYRRYSGYHRYGYRGYTPRYRHRTYGNDWYRGSNGHIRCYDGRRCDEEGHVLNANDVEVIELPEFFPKDATPEDIADFKQRAADKRQAQRDSRRERSGRTRSWDEERRERERKDRQNRNSGRGKPSQSSQDKRYERSWNDRRNSNGVPGNRRYPPSDE